MQVKLKVLQGSNSGREIKVRTKEFIIGRKEGCHIRPKSDLISRKHCMLIVGESGVIARDLKSRNGTYVNDERIEGDRPLKFGDRVRVGKLEFEVLIDHGIGGAKKPQVRDVKEAAARMADSAPAKQPVKVTQDDDDDDVSNWLDEADDVAQEKASDTDTRQYKVDETDRVPLEKPKSDETVNTSVPEASDDTKVLEKPDQKKEAGKKKEPGKLPKLPSTTTKDSRDAAAMVLKNFFNRR